MNRLNKKIARRSRIRKGIRKHMKGTTGRPRLSVFRSNSAIYAQIIDDVSGRTLVSASSLGIEKGEQSPISLAHQTGKQLAEAAKQNNIEMVVFDRNGYLYHGRVKALAEGAREAGLNF
jgi:large subunit ribosomal protein L18